MSELKLNLVDANRLISGAIHGSVAESCVAALSAEPETISELAAALARYLRPGDDGPPFACLHEYDEVDYEPYDAGLDYLSGKT